MTETAPQYDPREQDRVLAVFTNMLRYATRDGGKKRAAGTKPPWYADGSHETAMYRHLRRWQKGEQIDPDSGVHPLVHLAWRALGIAAIESGVV
jgi:hypothetical protein